MKRGRRVVIIFPKSYPSIGENLYNVSRTHTRRGLTTGVVSKVRTERFAIIDAEILAICDGDFR